MTRNSLTTLGSLREGDRFTYPGKQDVWQVTTKIGKESVAINKIENGNRLFKYDDIIKGTKQVQFLRHTWFTEGEACTVSDLNEGDTFFKENDLITEYSLNKKMPGQGVAMVSEHEGIEHINLSEKVVVIKSTYKQPA